MSSFIRFLHDALKTGLVDKEEIVKWADTEILSGKEIDNLVYELSLSNDKYKIEDLLWRESSSITPDVVNNLLGLLKSKWENRKILLYVVRDVLSYLDYEDVLEAKKGYASWGRMLAESIDDISNGSADESKVLLDIKKYLEPYEESRINLLLYSWLK